MTEKRFTVHIKWFNYEKTEGEIELFDNGQPLLVSECIEDVRMVKDLLNELAEENKELKGKASSWKMTASEEVSEKQGLIKQIVELKKENEQLRKKLIYLIENGLKELFGEEYRIIEDIGDFE